MYIKLKALFLLGMVPGLLASKIWWKHYSMDLYLNACPVSCRNMKTVGLWMVEVNNEFWTFQRRRRKRVMIIMKINMLMITTMRRTMTTFRSTTSTIQMLTMHSWQNWQVAVLILKCCHCLYPFLCRTPKPAILCKPLTACFCFCGFIVFAPMQSSFPHQTYF